MHLYRVGELCKMAPEQWDPGFTNAHKLSGATGYNLAMQFFLMG